jgi:membrane protease YdiL (CAAX protease family)
MKSMSRKAKEDGVRMPMIKNAVDSEWPLVNVAIALFVPPLVFAAYIAWGPQHPENSVLEEYVVVEDFAVHLVYFRQFLTIALAIYLLLFRRAPGRLTSLFKTTDEKSAGRINLRFVALVGLGLCAMFIMHIIGSITTDLLVGVLSLESLINDELEPFELCKVSIVGWLFDIFQIIIIMPLLEEVTCRGVLLRSLAVRKYVVCGVIVSALYYSVLHFDSASFVAHTLAGIVLAFLVIKSGSLWPAIAVHSIFNLISIMRIA